MNSGYKGPLSPGQAERWLAASYDDAAASALNEQLCLRLRGTLDVDALTRALTTVLRRHPIGGICLSDEAPLQYFLPTEPASALQILDLSYAENPEKALAAHCHATASVPFALGDTPMLRLYVLKLSDSCHVLHLIASHLVFDGWAATVFAREVAQIYKSEVSGVAATLPEPECPIRFAVELSERFEGPEGESHRAATIDSLRPLPAPLVLADLAAPDSPTLRASTHVSDIEPKLYAAFSTKCRRLGVTPFQGLLAAVGATLLRLAGARECVLSVPYAGQMLTGADTLIADGVLDLMVRLKESDETPSIEALARQARRAIALAAECPLVTQGALARGLGLRASGNTPPITPFFFNLNPRIDLRDFAPLDAAFFEPERAALLGELFFSLYDLGDRYRLFLHHSAERYSPARVGHIVDEFRSAITELANGAEIDARPTRAWATAVASGPTRDLEEPALVDVVIDYQASLSPDKVAVEAAGRTLTYSELVRSSESIAEALRERGIGPGARVGVHLSRGVDMISALLGVWKSGAAYVPLDPSFPADRLAFMAQDAAVAAVLTEEDLLESCCIDGERRLVIADLLSAHGSAPRPISSARRVNGRDAAYVIYTSGSTGKPKGVVVTHRSVLNFLESMRREPGLEMRDRLLAVTTLSFDIAVLELFLPLVVGATVLVATREQVAIGELLAELIDDRGITVMQATPTSWNLLLEAGWRSTRGFKALCGGEALPGALAHELRARGCELWNMYGPTESTVWSTVARIGGPDDPITIGCPIANTGVWILDASLRTVPDGEVGELYITGEGVADGYLGRPDLTADRFPTLPGPRGSGPVRAYRTGDLASIGPDGRLRHHGRSDDQVKLRGHRIELGEIEAAMENESSVARAAAVLDRPSTPDARIVVFVQPRGSGTAPTEEALLAPLRRTLPAYMVPTRAICIDRLPVLPNGKIDRNVLREHCGSLPLPGPQSASLGRVRFANDLSRSIAGAMSEVLGLPSVGPDDDFFRLGGHSLSAVRLASAVDRLAGRRPSLKLLFQNPTPDTMASALGAVPNEQGPAKASIPRLVDQDVAPLSPMQRRVLFIENLSPGTAAFNMSSLHLLRGELDVARFRRAFGRMLRQQPALRTVIEEHGGNWRQRVRPLEDLPEAVGCYEAEADVATSWASFERRSADEIAKPYDLHRGPLFSAFLQRISATETAFFFQAHHLIWDAWSFDLLYAALAEGYSLADAEAEIQAPPVSYADFAAWQEARLQGDDLQRQAGYWINALQLLPPPAQLPLASRPPRYPTGRGGSFQVEVSSEVVARLHEVAQARGLTLFSVLFAAFALVLHRSTGQDDVVIGVPIRGREHPGLESVMGFFVNVLPIRSRIDSEASLGDWVAALRDVLVEGYANPDVPLEEIVERLGLSKERSRAPLYQTSFSFQDVRSRITSWGALQHSRLPTPIVGAQHDLAVWCVETPHCLELVFSYSADVLDEARARPIAERLAHLLEEMPAAFDRPLGAVDTLSAVERGHLARWNATARPFDEHLRFQDLFDTQVSARPQAVAASFPGQPTLTYCELDAKVDAMAGALSLRDVRAGSRVGLHLGRGIDFLVAQLAVLRLGAIYVPLDPAYPASRLAFMVKDAGCRLVLTHSSLAREPICDRSLLLFVDLEPIEAVAATGRGSPVAIPLADAQELAYVIYTSGSTGVPKGVAIPHRALTNFLLSMAQRPGMNSDDRIVAVTTPSFDIAVLELLLPLTVGARIAIAPAEVTMDGRALSRFIEIHAPTILQSTPTLLRMLIEAGWQPAKGLKVLAGGEPLPPDLAAELLSQDVELWNMYGPTETTVWSACVRVLTADAPMSIGRPIDNTQVAIVAADESMCGIGVTGEILIGGAGVALGYVGRDDLSVSKFVTRHPPGAWAGRWYRTGDLGRWLPDGTLQHLGRSDAQVKLRGYRIELTEVEAVVRSVQGVLDAIVALKTVDDAPVLVAYCQWADGPVSTEMLRSACRQSLPAYMIPQYFVPLPGIPRLPNGKTDRGGLPVPESHPVAVAAHAGEASGSGAVTTIAGIWCRVLHLEEVAPTDNFFDLGGRSLLAMRVALEITRTLGVEVTVRQLIFETLEEIASHVEARRPSAARPVGNAAGPLDRLVGRFRSMLGARGP